MTVARMGTEMPMPEYVNWHGFYRYREGKQRQQAAKDKARSQVGARGRHARR